MGPNVHPAHIAGQAQCTPAVILSPDDSVHAVYMAQAARKIVPRVKPAFGRTFIREWRLHRNLTLEQLADRIDTTHASLSRIERGKQPYTQPMLEALADALQTDPASLLMRDPSSPDAIWSIWESAQPGERRAIVELAKTVVAIKAKAG